MGDVPLVLHVVSAPEGSALVAGMVLHTEGGPVVVGRGDEADLRLLDSTVSRRHARLSVEGGQVVVERLTQGNGLYLDEVEVGERATSDQATATLQLGGVLLAVHRPQVSGDRTTEQVPVRLSRPGQIDETDARWVVHWDAQACTVTLDGRGLDMPPLASAFFGVLLETPDEPVHQWDLLERLGPKTNLNQCATLARRAIRRRVDAGEISLGALVEAIRAVDDVTVDEADVADVLKKVVGNQRGYGYVVRLGRMGVRVEHR